jgi:hypothetical protein
VVGLGAGEATTVTWTPHEFVYVNSYYKYGPGPNVNDPRSWYEFPYDGTTGAELVQEYIPTLGYEVTRRIILHFLDGARGDVDGLANGIIEDPGGPALVSILPMVASVTVNGGLPGGNSAQRSMINNLVVAFSEPVTIGKDAFELRRFGSRQAIGLKVALSQDGGRTIARLTFNGHGACGGSLANGEYRLTIRGAKIRSASGKLLDGDGDGVAGGNYASGFFRLFGDSDGDGDVDTLDRTTFQAAYSKRKRDPGYVWYLDANANGRVWAEDLALFLLGYSRSSKRH